MRSLSTTDHLPRDDTDTDTDIDIDIDNNTDIVDLSLGTDVAHTERKSQSLSRLDVLRVQVANAEQQVQQNQNQNNSNNFEIATTPAKVSLFSSVKGRAALLRTWVATNPLVSSAFEERDKNLARQTRQNTLHNRHSLRLRHNGGAGQRRVNTWSSLNTKYASEGEVSSSSSSSSSSMQSILFSGTVQAFYYNGEDTERLQKERQRQNIAERQRNGESDIDEEEDSSSSMVFIQEIVALKKPNKIPPLEVRWARARMNYPTDPSSPVSRGGQWISKQR